MGGEVGNVWPGTVAGAPAVTPHTLTSDARILQPSPCHRPTYDVCAAWRADTDIVDAKGFNFYMVSQAGLQGTCRPSHYHVLHCPPSLTQDEVRRCRTAPPHSPGRLVVSRTILAAASPRRRSSASRSICATSTPAARRSPRAPLQSTTLTWRRRTRPGTRPASTSSAMRGRRVRLRAAARAPPAHRRMRPCARCSASGYSTLESILSI